MEGARDTEDENGIQVWTHHPVLWVNCREGAWLSNVGRVTQHGGVAGG